MNIFRCVGRGERKGEKIKIKKKHVLSKTPGTWRFFLFLFFPFLVFFFFSFLFFFFSFCVTTGTVRAAQKYKWAPCSYGETLPFPPLAAGVAGERRKGRRERGERKRERERAHKIPRFPSFPSLPPRTLCFFPSPFQCFQWRGTAGRSKK